MGRRPRCSNALLPDDTLAPVRTNAGTQRCLRFSAAPDQMPPDCRVSTAMAAQQLLAARGVAVRVVSLPSTTVFDRQDAAWREQVLGRGLPRVGVEAGVSRWWAQYGCVAALGIDSFGESAPAAQLYAHFGLDAQRLADLVQAHCAATAEAPQ